MFVPEQFLFERHLLTCSRYRLIPSPGLISYKLITHIPRDGACRRLILRVSGLKLTVLYRDKTEVKQIPFFINALDGDLALSVNVTTQPSVGFKITMLAGE